MNQCQRNYTEKMLKAIARDKVKKLHSEYKKPKRFLWQLNTDYRKQELKKAILDGSACVMPDVDFDSWAYPYELLYLPSEQDNVDKLQAYNNTLENFNTLMIDKEKGITTECDNLTLQVMLGSDREALNAIAAMKAFTV